MNKATKTRFENTLQNAVQWHGVKDLAALSKLPREKVVLYPGLGWMMYDYLMENYSHD